MWDVAIDALPEGDGGERRPRTVLASLTVAPAGPGTGLIPCGGLLTCCMTARDWWIVRLAFASEDSGRDGPH
jgi:hypothetical protein